ncbi:596_t:CDS:1, partial [Entrophospora sp. SA101]
LPTSFVASVNSIQRISALFSRASPTLLELHDIGAGVVFILRHILKSRRLTMKLLQE